MKNAVTFVKVKMPLFPLLSVEPIEFDLFVANLNTRLDSFHMLLKSMTDPMTGKTMWMIINTLGDDIAQVHHLILWIDG